MRRASWLVLLMSTPLVSLAALSGACSDSFEGSTFGNGVPNGTGAGLDGAGGAGGPGGSTNLTIIPVDAAFGVDGSSPGSGDGSAASTGCASLSGTVFTPGKTDPLYNAIVYLAKGTVEPMTSGASCDKCSPLSAAKAVTATLTGPDGKFKLTGVPLGDNVPLVIELGKWRRTVSVKVTGCGDAPVSDDLTRLPKNQSEGHIPLMAISTGGADSLECILRKMGIDDSEFTVPAGPGRIQMYHATGAVAQSGTTPDQAALWTNVDNLKRYDMVLLPCEHAPNTGGKTPGYANLVDYTAAGGRAFITHYNYTWIREPTTRFPQTSNWTAETKYFGTNYDFPMTANVNLGFQKGKDFAQWLVNVGASSTYGEIELNHVVHNEDSAMPDVAQPWLSSDSQERQYTPQGGKVTQQILHHYTFNTPVGAAPESQCGRVVYSSFHVNDASSDDKTFPAECDTKPLTAQEKVLMFMLFDLASCVQTDKEPPVRPIPR